jgi:hypothetical protein
VLQISILLETKTNWLDFNMGEESIIHQGDEAGLGGILVDV